MRTPLGGSLAVVAAACVSAASLSAQRWRSETGRPRLFLSGIAYDSARGQVVRFGGSAAPQLDSFGFPAVNETWVRDAAGWREVATAHAPSARMQHGLVFDAARQRIVLFGGLTASSLSDETWEFDGVDWTLVATAQSPSPRIGLAIAYDAARQRVVVYGGGGSTGALPDTWEYDGINWAQSQAVSPAASSADLTYVPNLARCILVGFPPFGSTMSTWSYDGTSWTLLAPVHAPPTFGSQAVDPSGFLVKLCDPTFSSMPETWRFDGIDWVLVTTGTTRHSPNAPMVFDSQRGRVVMVDDATSEFDGVAWTEVEPSRLIEDHSNAAIAFDAGRNRVVLFGGFASARGGTDDHWEWDGAVWTLIPHSVAPSRRYEAVMAYDSRRHRLVLQGGARGLTQFSDTWEYDGQTWSQVVTAHAPVHVAGAMVYDSVLGRCVLYAPQVGTANAPATWTYDGSDWTMLATTQEPPARLRPSMAFDAARNVVVLHGGAGPSGSSFTDTWELRNGDWTRRNPQIRPPAHTGTATFDPVAGRVVLGAGVYTTSVFGQYEFDGVLWQRRPGTHLPPLFSSTDASLFDPVRQRTLTISIYGEVWSYERAPVATWTRLGVGCTQGAVRPELDAVAGSTPQLGGALSLQVTGLPPQPGALWLAFGVGLATWNGVALPVPLGVLGLPACLAWIEPTTFGFLVAHNGGTAVTTIAVPSVPAFAGLQFGVQGIGLDAARPFGIGWVTNAGVGTAH